MLKVATFAGLRRVIQAFQLCYFHTSFHIFGIFLELEDQGTNNDLTKAGGRILFEARIVI